jgi:hypothetical protein
MDGIDVSSKNESVHFVDVGYYFYIFFHPKHGNISFAYSWCMENFPEFSLGTRTISMEIFPCLFTIKYCMQPCIIFFFGGGGHRFKFRVLVFLIKS